MEKPNDAALCAGKCETGKQSVTVSYDPLLYKLVPMEPTQAMLKAGECSGMCGDGSVRAVEFIIDSGTVAEIYANVIAAAPAQPGEGE